MATERVPRTNKGRGVVEDLSTAITSVPLVQCQHFSDFDCLGRDLSIMSKIFLHWWHENSIVIVAELILVLPTLALNRASLNSHNFSWSKKIIVWKLRPERWCVKIQKSYFGSVLTTNYTRNNFTCLHQFSSPPPSHIHSRAVPCSITTARGTERRLKRSRTETRSLSNTWTTGTALKSLWVHCVCPRPITSSSLPKACSVDWPTSSQLAAWVMCLNCFCAITKTNSWTCFIALEYYFFSCSVIINSMHFSFSLYHCMYSNDIVTVEVHTVRHCCSCVPFSLLAGSPSVCGIYTSPAVVLL